LASSVSVANSRSRENDRIERRPARAQRSICWIGAWSGIPYFFLQAGKEQGFLSAGLSLRPEDLRRRRLFWNLGRVLRGSRPGGFQYSEAFLRRLFAQAGLRDDEEVEIISHFPLLPPRPWPRGWRISYYIDATLRQNFIHYGVAHRIGRKAREDVLRRELEHYHAAERIVCMSRWAANSVVENYGIASSKVHVILPGANLRDADAGPPTGPAEPPLDPLRLGFIGKDWRRKGLPFLLRVAEELARRRIGVPVVALGPCARDLPSHPLLESVGFVDKQHDSRRFVQLVRSFHFGCLFSSAEAYGIANLECMRLGVPVLASRVGGIPDTVREGLAYLFAPACPPADVADLLESFVRDRFAYQDLRQRVARSSSEFSWRRTVRDFIAVWQGAEPLAA
jgi:glycosyltransferase involved in cell wall biosynthesis